MKTYTDKSNASRAAKKQLAALGCPDPKNGSDFVIKQNDDGRFFVELLNPWATFGDFVENATEAPEPVPAPAVPEIDGAALAADSGEANNEPPAAKKQSKHDLQVEAAYQAGLAGEDAPVLEITSAANLSYQKRADKLRDVALSIDRAALATIEIGGVNTYAQKLRAYQLELAAWIVGHKEHTKQEGQG